MRWLSYVPVCAVLALSLLTASCFVSDKTVACDTGDDLTIAALRFQFTNNYSSVGKRAAVYFVSIEEERDPPAAVLEQFAGHEPPVRPRSDLTMSETDERVVDPMSGAPALMFRIFQRTLVSDSEAIVEGGYYEANLSASWITMRALCQEGSWQIEKIGPDKIARIDGPE